MGIFQTLVDKYKDGKQKSLNKKEFRSALLQAASDGKLTKEEIDELDKKKSELGLTDDEIQHNKKELARLRLLNEIQQGNMPTMPPITNLITQKGEKIYWAEPSILAEEKVISRKYQGGSQGMSFRIMKTH